MTVQRLTGFIISPKSSVREALECINRNGSIALVLDAERRLLGTITDGDVRRAVLAGIKLDSPVQFLLGARDKAVYPQPITAPMSASVADLLRLMKERSVRQIPLLDDNGRVEDIALMQELIKEYDVPLKAVVMAGGFGKRLRPLTENVPKPMLPIGDKPILELILTQLQNAGISKIQLTTHYKPDVIRRHFGDGSKFGIQIEYVDEHQPLGTAGALASVPVSEEPMLVLNGDVLTHVDFKAMVAFHREHGADLTVGVRQYDFQVPYGVVRCDDADIREIEEKPTLNFFVNAGVYLLEPSAHRSVPHAQRFDMTDLIEKLKKDGRRIVAFPIVEYWMDIGRHVDYEQAQEDVKQWRKTQ